MTSPAVVACPAVVPHSAALGHSTALAHSAAPAFLAALAHSHVAPRVVGRACVHDGPTATQHMTAKQQLDMQIIALLEQGTIFAAENVHLLENNRYLQELVTYIQEVYQRKEEVYQRKEEELRQELRHKDEHLKHMHEQMGCYEAVAALTPADIDAIIENDDLMLLELFWEAEDKNNI